MQQRALLRDNEQFPQMQFLSAIVKVLQETSLIQVWWNSSPGGLDFC